MTLVAWPRSTERRCPICGAPNCACVGDAPPGGARPVDLIRPAGGVAMADIGRYVDDKGNIFKLTAEQARELGYKAWTKPAAAATDESKSTPKPPADKAR
jgi:hypothetical protein